MTDVCRICKIIDKKIKWGRISKTKRGYLFNIPTRFAKQAHDFKQSDLLDIKPKASNKKPILVIQYNTFNHDINKWVRKDWKTDIPG